MGKRSFFRIDIFSVVIFVTLTPPTGHRRLITEFGFPIVYVICCKNNVIYYRINVKVVTFPFRSNTIITVICPLFCCNSSFTKWMKFSLATNISIHYFSYNKCFHVLDKLIMIILMDARKMYRNTHVHRTKFFKSSFIRYAIDEKSWIIVVWKKSGWTLLS